MIEKMYFESRVDKKTKQNKTARKRTMPGYY